MHWPSDVRGALVLGARHHVGEVFAEVGSYCERCGLVLVVLGPARSRARRDRAGEAAPTTPAQWSPCAPGCAAGRSAPDAIRRSGSRPCRPTLLREPSNSLTPRHSSSRGFVSGARRARPRLMHVAALSPDGEPSAERTVLRPVRPGRGTRWLARTAHAQPSASMTVAAVAAGLSALPLRSFDDRAVRSLALPPAEHGFYAWWQTPAALPGITATRTRRPTSSCCTSASRPVRSARRRISARGSPNITVAPSAARPSGSR